MIEKSDAGPGLPSAQLFILFLVGKQTCAQELLRVASDPNGN
jgi:hypothetical protein